MLPHVPTGAGTPRRFLHRSPITQGDPLTRYLIAVLVLVLGAASFSSAAATGNGAPSGAHYTLNVIGVPKDKTAEMTGANGRVIFTKLQGQTKINLQEGAFQVIDANGTDGNGALFQLPNPDPDGDGVTAYSVYARALGKPGGNATATSCVTDDTGTYCSTESVLLVRGTGKSSFSNVSRELLSVCLDTDGDGACDTRTSLFGDDAYSYLWQYDNNGLRLAQLRFYEVPSTLAG
jgi:hypothetical protein